MQFKDFLLQLKDGDLIELRSNTLFGKGIRRVTKKCVNHTAVISIINKKPYLIDWDIYNNYSKQLLIKLQQNILKCGDVTDMFWLQLKPEYNNYRSHIISEIFKMSMLKYNTVGLIDVILKKSKPLPGKKVFCSQAIQIALINSALLNKNYNNESTLVPGDFHHTGLYNSPIKIEI